MRQLGPRDNRDLIFLLYDSLRQAPSANRGWTLNSSIPVLRGIAEASLETPPVVGAGLIGSLGFEASQLFCGDRISRQVAVAVNLPTRGSHYTRIMHGCTPLDGSYHTITRADGANLYELDGRPIVEVINELYGDAGWQNQEPVVHLLAVGINHGDRLGDSRECDFVTRLIVGALPDQSGIVVFETDLKEGDEILFMLRDTSQMIESARDNAMQTMSQITADGRKPLFAVYVDCGGRTAEFSHTLTEEATEIQKVLNEYDTPLLGFYSGVEVAPFRGKNCGLDWTGVLVVLTDEGEGHA